MMNFASYLPRIHYRKYDFFPKKIKQTIWLGHRESKMSDENTLIQFDEYFLLTTATTDKRVESAYIYNNCGVAKLKRIAKM